MLVSRQFVLHLLRMLGQVAYFAFALPPQHLADTAKHRSHYAIVQIMPTHEKVTVFGRHAQLLYFSHQRLVRLPSLRKHLLQAGYLAVHPVAQLLERFFRMIKIQSLKPHHAVEINH